MDLDEIKELMAAMQEADLSEICIREKGFEVILKRGVCSPTQHHIAPTPTHAPKHVEEVPVAPISPPPAEECRFISSPMVGTFYNSPSPDDPSFVKVGDQVTPDTVVCIVEAMKVMNEVKAGVSGRIEAFCVDNAETVEFGTKLFKIK
ncbi:MAG: acetyl-CoA carboxylase biotin carboxyl carrier protein [Chlamydiales bacterium]|nr:acetyl-CoA carboxylase biotin carboxyl carrier protein [Chlamydiales bacterium]